MLELKAIQHLLPPPAARLVGPSYPCAPPSTCTALALHPPRPSPTVDDTYVLTQWVGPSYPVQAAQQRVSMKPGLTAHSPASAQILHCSSSPYRFSNWIPRSSPVHCKHKQTTVSERKQSRSPLRAQSVKAFRLSFFKKRNLVDTCPFMGPLIPLFWTFGDVSSRFQSQSGL